MVNAEEMNGLQQGVSRIIQSISHIVAKMAGRVRESLSRDAQQLPASPTRGVGRASNFSRVEGGAPRGEGRAPMLQGSALQLSASIPSRRASLLWTTLKDIFLNDIKRRSIDRVSEEMEMEMRHKREGTFRETKTST